MATIRLVALEARRVPWLGNRTVQPDEVVTVPDDHFEAYVCQPDVWQPVQEPASADAEAAPARRGRSTHGGE